MKNRSALSYINELERPVFTTAELSSLSGKSPSAITQTLSRLEKQGIVIKARRGIWAKSADKNLSPFSLIPLLSSKQRLYVSFISALQLYGIIEQIPQVITLASLSHTKKIHTKFADFQIHRISPDFFAGFNWYKNTGDFLIAEPEKALVDCIYISSRKNKQFTYFPEMRFPRSFSFTKARNWAKRIPDKKIQAYALKELEKYF